MQALHDENCYGSSRTNAGPTEGLLEDSNGVVCLYRGGQLIAKCYGVRSHHMDGTYELEAVTHAVEWRRWAVRRVVWSHTSALLFLQGVTLQQLVQPLLLLAGSPLHISNPEPGLRDVVLAEIYSAPPELVYAQLFQLLVPEALGA